LKMDHLRNRSGEYSDVPANLYYGYVADEDGQSTKLDIYGLNRGETDDMSATYPGFAEWIAPDEIIDSKLTSLFRFDPDQNQFWPIWQVFIDASTGMLKNDYGY